MTLLDRLSDRVGDFLEEVMLPEEIHHLHQRARRAIEDGDYQQALQFLGEAEHRRPQTERTRRMRALSHFYLGNLDRAVELFDEALELREEAASHFYLGICHERRGEFGDAYAHFRRAFELDDDPDFAYDLHFGLGRIHLARGRADKATRALRRALRIWPDQTEAAVYLAEALHRRGRLDEARQTIRDAIGDNPDRRTLMTLGAIDDATDHHDDAAEAYEAILEQSPDDHEALVGAARAHLSAGRHGRANELLIRALEKTDDDAGVFALIAETNERIDNLDKARESYEAALSRDPDHEEALLGAANTALRLDDHRAAAGYFERLLAITEDHRAEALLGLGRCRLATGDPVGARHLLEEADQLWRQRPPELLYALGAVALESDDPAEALVAFRRALHVEPGGDLRARLDSDIDRALDALQPDWRLPDSFDSTADLVASLTELRDHLSAEPNLEDFLPDIHRLLQQLDNPLSVAVLGEFNSGKSTLVNALLGEDVVPTGVLPTTAHPCVMGYGPRKGVRIAYEEGDLEDVDFATARTKMKDEADEIARLDYTYPHPELRSINYLDTPGFNALDDRHERLAAEALEDAEAIIWLLDANQALSETEFSRLRSIPDSSLRVILLVNKIDRFGDGDNRGDEVGEIVDYLEKHTGDQVLDILAISALEAFEARTNTDEAEKDDGEPKPQTTDDFDRLQALLDEHFVQRSWRIKISEISRELRRLVDDIEQLRRDQIEEFDDLIDEARRLGELVDDTAGSPRSTASEYALALEDRFDFVVVGIEREIDDALRRRGRIFSRVVLEADDRDFILELFEERLDDVLRRSRQKVLAEISELEATMAERLSPLFATLSVTDARPLRRRLEGFFDETRALKTVLEERVFGQWRARARGQIATGGTSTLEAIADLGADASPKERRQLLAGLIPQVGDEFSGALTAWYEEFFLAANRFCDRLRRDLETLQLEVRHRLDFSGD